MQKLLILFVFLLSAGSLFAQTPSREDAARDDLDYYSDGAAKTERPEGFGSNLWYGGGVQLGFQSTSFESLFIIGLSPMVGYKLTNALSVGPRTSLVYNAYRVRNTGPSDFKTNYFTWEFGIFARAKVFNTFFAHAEYSLESDVIGFSQDADPIRRTRGMPYLGIGYSPYSGGGASSEVLLLFRLNRDGQSIQEAPFVIRAGLNFNF